jgi:hypothetical protein
MMPRALMVEYLPVEFTEAGEDGRVFAKNLTQFYFRYVYVLPTSNKQQPFTPVQSSRVLLRVATVLISGLV